MSCPAPLLERLTIDGCSVSWLYHNPTLTPALFNGDFSSLRRLCLQHVHTELPWRNMINLTSFALENVLSGDTSIGQFLDFFEGAPHLRNVRPHFATPTSVVNIGDWHHWPAQRRWKSTGVNLRPSCSITC